jgi:antibiotic biosynthesis monooxygenase (ABM) superfamily enzyme
MKTAIMKTKMKLIASLKIWIVIYPSITLFYYFFGEQLSALPLFARTFSLTVSLVPWMMFVGVPLVDHLLQKLSQKGNKKGKNCDIHY